jgi:hypothetical protein
VVDVGAAVDAGVEAAAELDSGGLALEVVGGAVEPGTSADFVRWVAGVSAVEDRDATLGSVASVSVGLAQALMPRSAAIAKPAAVGRLQFMMSPGRAGVTRCR